MKKKQCIISILIIDFIFIALLIMKGNYGKRFDNYIVTEEEFEAILKTHDKSETALISDLIFDESFLFYDSVNGIFYYSLIDDAEAYNPMIKIVSQDAKANIAIKEEKITDELIGGNNAIDFVIYTDRHYFQYQLKCTTLPIMNINVENGITEEDTQMKMELFDNRVEAPQRIVRSEGLIHIRGASTKRYPKLGYKISLVNKYSLLGMRHDDDWILYAAYNDQEKIRNVFSSNLWMETCSRDNTFYIENGMRYEYIELFFNGEYWGLYALGYPIDDLQMDTKNPKECIYKNCGWTNEYLIEYEDNGTIAGYEISSYNKNDWTLLYEFYEKFNSNDTDDSWYYTSMDIENAIDYMLFMNLIQGTDNVSGYYTKNMYLTAKLSNDGTYKYLYTPWDMDLTWGNVSTSGVTFPYAIDSSVHRLMESGSLYHLLIKHDETAWMAYLEKYEELRNEVWSDETIENMLKEYEHQIFDSGAYLRDMDRWPDGLYENPELKLTVFIQYVLTRLHEMDEYYERLAQVRKENVYIIRSAQHKNFKNSRFIIKIGDEFDKDMKELFEYIGIPVEEIPKDSVFIFYNVPDGKIEYRKDDSGIPFEYDWSENDDFLIFFQQSAGLGWQPLWLG